MEKRGKARKQKEAKKKSTEFATDCNLVLSEMNKMSRLRRGVTKKKKKEREEERGEKWRLVIHDHQCTKGK